MLGSGKSTSIVSSFSSMLLKAWNEWDVRIMVVFSLLLQIILSVLGDRRIYTTHFFITNTILWISYLSADWFAIATLGKLSSSGLESPTTNVLRAIWAPLLILHLGGPYTITAYAYEDNKFWNRHLFTLFLKVILTIYIILLSWTPSWPSLFTIPLIIGGIASYVERILCLRLNNSHESKPIIPLAKILQESFGSQPIVKDKAHVLAAYVMFSLRPDVNNYLSYSLSTAKIRVQTCFLEIFGQHAETPDFKTKLRDVMIDISKNIKDPFDVFIAELGLIFDFVYTKFPLLQTTKGTILSLAKAGLSEPVLLVLWIRIMNESKFHFSRVDICITGVLLLGAYALAFHGIYVATCSNWTIVGVALDQNEMRSKIYWSFYRGFWSFSELLGRKRWSNQMGQFDLPKYCWSHKKRQMNKACVCLQKIPCVSDLIEMRRKHLFTKFVEVPGYLKQRMKVYANLLESIIQGDNHPLEASRGKRALQKRQQYEVLKWSIESDFDYSIIVWHLATSACYDHNESQNAGNEEARTISKCISEYMMYLLAIRPTLQLPDDGESFWLVHTYDKLKELFSPAVDTKAACELLLDLDDDGDREQNLESSNLAFENILKDVRKLAKFLKESQSEDKWEMIKEVWIEMLLYAAFSSSHTSHFKQLGEGAEFLSILWLVCVSFIVLKAYPVQPSEGMSSTILGIFPQDKCSEDSYTLA